MKQHALILVVAALAFGCLESSPGTDSSSDRSDDIDSNSGSDPWDLAEGDPSDQGGPALDAANDSNIVQPDDRPTCVEAETFAFTSMRRFDLSPFARFELAVADDRVFVVSQGEDGEPAALTEWTPSGLVRYPPADGLAGEIIGFSNAHVWFSAVTLVGEEHPGVVTGLNSTRRFDLATNEVVDLDFEVNWERRLTDIVYAAPRQTAAADRFAWSAEDRVNLLSGDGPPEVIATEAAARPWVTEDAVAYRTLGASGRQDSYGSIHAQVGGEHYETTSLAQGWPVLARDKVYFLRGGKVVSSDLRDGFGEVIEVLDDVGCGPLDTDGETVVTACGDRESHRQNAVDYYFLSPTRVWSIDAPTGAARQVGESTAMIYAPVVNDRWFAWVEYEPSLQADGAIGRIMVLPRGVGGVATEVGRMSRDDYGRMPPRLLLGENTLAWNYAEEPDPETSRLLHPYGVARLRPCD